MTAKDAIINCLFKKCLDFKTRSQRSEFWWFFIFTAVVVLLSFFLFRSHLINITTLYVILIFISVPFLAVLVRRLHDRNRSAYIIAAPLVITLVAAFIGVGFAFIFDNYLLYLVYFFCALCALCVICILISCLKEGDRNENDYGMPP